MMRGPIYPGGPDEDWDDTICANCLCDLPDEDPDPENTGASPWWDGFCSEPCRKGVPVPFDALVLRRLDAYQSCGASVYWAGYSDEWSKDNICGCPTVCKPNKPVQGPVYGADGACTTCGGREDRGDWSVHFAFIVWKHPSRGVLVAYEAVVNSDSAGFIELAENGVVKADQAPLNLPDRHISYGMDHDTAWTDAEMDEAYLCQEKWKRDLEEAINTAKGGSK